MKTEVANLDIHADEYVAAFPVGMLLFIVTMTPKSARVTIGGKNHKVQISGDTPTRSELFAKLQQKVLAG